MMETDDMRIPERLRSTRQMQVDIPIPEELKPKKQMQGDIENFSKKSTWFKETFRGLGSVIATIVITLGVTINYDYINKKINDFLNPPPSSSFKKSFEERRPALTGQGKIDSIEDARKNKLESLYHRLEDSLSKPYLKKISYLEDKIASQKTTSESIFRNISYLEDKMAERQSYIHIFRYEISDSIRKIYDSESVKIDSLHQVYAKILNSIEKDESKKREILKKFEEYLTPRIPSKLNAKK